MRLFIRHIIRELLTYYSNTMLKFHSFSIKQKLITIILLVSTIASLTGYLLILNNDVKMLKDSMKTNSIINAALIAENSATPVALDYNDAAYETLERIKAIQGIEAGVIYKADGSVFAEYLKKNARYEN